MQDLDYNLGWLVSKWNFTSMILDTGIIETKSGKAYDADQEATQKCEAN